MHTMLSRLNAVSAFATSVLLTVLAAVSLVSYLQPHSIQPASLKVNTLNVMLGRSNQNYDRKEREYAFARFDISADLQPLFQWNTKQVFVYFVAEYQTGKYPVNQVVIWDRIIRRKKDARVSISSAKNKYAFKEITESFKNVTATFSLQYNIMPYVGLLEYGEAGRSEEMKFPDPKSGIVR